MKFGPVLDGLVFFAGCATIGAAAGIVGGVVWKLCDYEGGSSPRHSDPEFQKRYAKFMANFDPEPTMSYYSEQLERLPFGAVLKIPGAPFDLVRGG